MKANELNGTSLAFIGDAVYSLYIRQYYVKLGYQTGKKLQDMTKYYVSAKGQTKAYWRIEGLLEIEEKNYFKKGRNSISHIPKNGDRKSYMIASGLEALIGYLYLEDQKRLDYLMEEILKGGERNEGFDMGS